MVRIHENSDCSTNHTQGVPEWPVASWAAKVGLPVNKQYAFHNTTVSKSECRLKNEREFN